MKILIIRHGDPNYEIDGLTDEGWRQAELLGQRLARLPIEAAYCSPCGRAQDTAKPWMRLTGQKVTTLPWLHELKFAAMNGENEPTQCASLMPQFWCHESKLFTPDWQEHPAFAPGVDELGRIDRGFRNLMAVWGYEREQNGLMYRCEHNDEKIYALFCHQCMGSALLGLILGVPVPVMLHSFFMSVTSVTTLVTEERKKGEIFLRCASMSDTSHLEAPSRRGIFPEVYPDA